MKNSVSVLFMLAGILFATCLLISNILATKILLIGSWAAPAGVLIFPIAYILNDVITEVWGFAKARLIIWTGFVVNVLAVLFFTMGIAIPGAPFWQNQEAFATVLGNTPAKAILIKMHESALSPTKVERMARMEKPLPFVTTFIRLITKAFRNDPIK